MKKIALILFGLFLGTSAHASINVISGNLSHRQELFSAGSGPLALSVGLTYNSFDRLAGPLGPGWSHGYDIYLHQNSDGTMVLTGGVGKRFYFPQADGSYKARTGDFSTLVKNADNTWTLTLRSGAVYRFGADKKIASLADRHGNTLTFDRTVANQVTVRDPAGRSAVFTLDAAGKLQSLADPAGNQFDFAYGGAGRLWKVTYPAPATGGTRPVWEFLYNAQGLLEYLKDPEGHVTKYGYDSAGRLVRTVDPEGVLDTVGGENAAGHLKTLQYDIPAAGRTTVTEKDGGAWVYAYDKTEGILTGKSDPAGSAESYSHYPAGHAWYGMVQEKSEPVDADTVYVATYLSYDGSGNPLEVTGHARHFTDTGVVDDPADAHLTYTYGSYDRLASVTDQIAGTVTTLSYVTDPATGKETVTLTAPKVNAADPSGPQTVLVYDAKGRLETVTDPLGRVTTYVYNPANGDLVSVTEATGVKSEFLDYDSLGNPRTVKVTGTDGAVQQTLLGYDALSRLQSVTRPGVVLASGAPPVDLLTQFGYDLAGNRTSVTDAENRTTGYDYNYRGQVTEITDALLNKTVLQYSGAGCGSCGGGVDKLIGVIDANHSGGDPATAKKTAFAYYPTGELKSETDPLGKRILYSYYPSGLLKEKRRDANGDGEIDPGDPLLLSFVYAPDGRIESKTDHLTGETTTFTYWPDGRLKSAANAGITYTFDYYANGWLKSVADGARTIEYEYDASGRRELTRIKEGQTALHLLDYVYDAQKRLKDIISTTGTFTFGYDGFGRRQSLSYPNGVQAGYDYSDQADWLTGIAYTVGGADLLRLGYPAHDKVGNRKDRVEDGVSTGFSYDATYQLTQAKTGAAEENFTYDSVGNRQSGPTVKDTEAAAYEHDDSNRMTKGRKFAYEYDDSGNQTKRVIGIGKEWRFTWDGENRLVEAKLVDNAAVLRTVTFKHDPFGRRVEKKVVDAAGAVTRTYVYDGEDIILEHVNSGTATTLTHYIHGPGIDEPLAMVRGGQAYYYHADGLGSVIAITDSQQSVKQRYSYESLGMLTPSDPLFENPYTYTGREWDKEIGLFYYRARYFDPMDGRFISKDPIGFAGGDWNLYGYVQNNPINFIDSDGLIKDLPYIGPNFGPVLYTDMRSGRTTFDPGLINGGEKVSIPTMNKVDSKAKNGANDPYDTNKQPLVYPNGVSLVPNTNNPVSYGPPESYISTGDFRGRDIHGGGSCKGSVRSQDDYQGWCVTYGCTRGQNKDVQDLYNSLKKFLDEHQYSDIPYVRYK